jgi:hypothetical protein
MPSAPRVAGLVRTTPPERADIREAGCEQPIVDVGEAHRQEDPEQQNDNPSCRDGSEGQELMLPNLVEDVPNAGGHSG